MLLCYAYTLYTLSNTAQLYMSVYRYLCVFVWRRWVGQEKDDKATTVGDFSSVILVWGCDDVLNLSSFLLWDTQCRARLGDIYIGIVNAYWLHGACWMRGKKFVGSQLLLLSLHDRRLDLHLLDIRICLVEWSDSHFGWSMMHLLKVQLSCHWSFMISWSMTITTTTICIHLFHHSLPK